ncbi:hypothetical protein D3C75_1082910 [compost metagenome]
MNATLGKCIDQRRQRTVALTAEVELGAAHVEHALQVSHSAFADQFRLQQPVGLALLQIMPGKAGKDHLATDLLARYIRLLLDQAAELHLQPARHHDPMLFQQIGHAAFAGLAIDANDRLITAPHIRRINRQIRHFPEAIGIGLAHCKAFLDRVLMRP